MNILKPKYFAIVITLSGYFANSKAQSDSLKVLTDSITKDKHKSDRAQTEHIQTKDSLRAMLIDSLINYATTHLGKPYRGGGKGPNAFDCSGFTGYVFSKFGYQLSSSSATQYTEGIHVNYKDIQRGDLVFFTGRNAKSGTVGHVGIVYEIDPLNDAFYFIHASSSEGIRIDIYPDKYYYYKRFIGIKRIIVEDELGHNIPSVLDLNNYGKEKNATEELEKESKEENTDKKEATEENAEKSINIYKVKKGDNLYQIAKKNHCKVEQIMEWNNLKNDKLSIDQELIIKTKK